LALTGIRSAVVTTGANLNRKNLDACVRDIQHVRLSVSSIRRDIFSKVHVGLNYDRICGDIASRIENRTRRNLAHSLGITLTEKEHVQMPRVLFALNILGHKLKNPHYCPVGDSSVSVSYKGDFLGCFQDFGHTSTLGTVFSDTLSNMVKSRRSKLGSMPICRNCDAGKVALLA
jgi:hypothetical protein